jgi:hypothetical protein
LRISPGLAESVRGNHVLLGNNKNDLATNYANYAKTTTARSANDEETTNCVKTAKNRHFLSLLFSRPGRFLLSLMNLFFFLRVIREIRG